MTESDKAEVGGDFTEVPLPLDCTWVIKDEVIGCCPAFFPYRFTFECEEPVLVRVTDLFAAGDSYWVYDHGELLFTMDNATDYGPTPPWTDDPDTAYDLKTGPWAHLYRQVEPGEHSITIKAMSMPTGLSNSTVAISARPVPRLDVRPGNANNVINLRAKGGVLTVALLGSEHVDVTEVDIRFPLHLGAGGATPIHNLSDPKVYEDHLQDVNRDGHTDLVLHYRIGQTGIKEGDTSVTFMGKMKVPNSIYDWFTCSDSIRTVPAKKVK
ncbi:MAG: hypothetical protein QME75_14940 [Deltaproteobacteria bacterium]|nr:hypothetical protein [Deltaproteobacteria bacterium]